MAPAIKRLKEVSPLSYLSLEEIIAGTSMTYDFDIPADKFPGFKGKKIKLKPLTVRDFRIADRLNSDSPGSGQCYLIMAGLVSPKIENQDDVLKFPEGLADWILIKLYEISGVVSEKEIKELIKK